MLLCVVLTFVYVPPLTITPSRMSPRRSLPSPSHHSPNNLALRAATITIFICASVAFVGTVPFYLIQLSFFKGPPSASALRTGDDIMVSNIVAQRVMVRARSLPSPSIAGVPFPILH